MMWHYPGKSALREYFRSIQKRWCKAVDATPFSGEESAHCAGERGKGESSSSFVGTFWKFLIKVEVALPRGNMGIS
uniref:Uncharacterized protein n=1 Tax=Nelumbo nucifera TaxID=4432 RepID=A0A822Z3N9_NELNU|nr:TPA_asm: hypothetical protein HUJ06_013583 [Nelumbo nucifera]